MNKKSPLELADELVDLNLKWNSLMVSCNGEMIKLFNIEDELKQIILQVRDIRQKLSEISVDGGE
jgi:hypothetical protein